MEDDLIICRCEEVTKGEICDVVRHGAQTADEVKRLTRAGMGLCQGKTCRRLVNRILAEETGRDIREIKPSSFRPPVRPLPLGFFGRKEIH